PCLFQIELCRAQLAARPISQDIISVAATGSGKTLTFLMPLLFNGGKFVLIITALNILGDQFVTQATEAGFSSITVTSENDTDTTFESIRKFQFRVIVINPEIFTKRGGHCQKRLWPHKPFRDQLFNFVLDEGHCVTQWGSTFRPEYAEVGLVRYFVPEVPMFITSATIPHSMIASLKETLHLSDNLLFFQRSNDRHNISFSVWKMKYPQNSYQDLAFLIPKDWKAGDPIPKKFMVFFNSKKEAEDACIFLRSLMPPDLRSKIMWFHAGMTQSFRTEEIESFKNGETWGLGLTDVGGMGLDIPDVQIIVQWKVPKDLNTLMQRFGRGGRNFSLEATAILIAEPKWFYDEHLKKCERNLKRKRARQNTNTHRDASDLEPEEASNVNTTILDDIIMGKNPQEVEEKILRIGETTKKQSSKKRTIDNAMKLFINAKWLSGRKRCRRYHSNRYYDNDKITPASEFCCERCAPKIPPKCCDLCHPDEVTAMIPSGSYEPPTHPRAPTKIKDCEFTLSTKEEHLKDQLLKWREETAVKLWGSTEFFPADMLLHVTVVDRIVQLAHAHAITTVTDLSNQTHWAFCDRYG
ncbi:P-loop containing nucleoside triphosphate hydrolase protein, partial [Flammula alnicola]